MSLSCWEVYIILSKNGKLYTGITNNLDKRFKEHLEGKNGARFFHFAEPDRIVYREKQGNRSEASKREWAIKKLTRAQKLALIGQHEKEKL